MPSLRRLTPTDAADVARIESASWRAAYGGILPTRSLRRMTLGGVPRRGFKSSLETGSSLAGFKRIFPGAQHEIDTVELTDESRRLVLLREKGVAKVQVPYVLANWLRPHQRVGVKFMFDCVAGISLPPFTGCILADDVSGSLKNNYG